jgi:hypothetical protein
LLEGGSAVGGETGFIGDGNGLADGKGTAGATGGLLLIALVELVE